MPLEMKACMVKASHEDQLRLSLPDEVVADKRWVA